MAADRLCILRHHSFAHSQIIMASGTTLNVVNWIGAGLSTGVFAIRAWTRLFIVRSIGLDDFFMLLSLVGLSRKLPYSTNPYLLPLFIFHQKMIRVSDVRYLL